MAVLRGFLDESIDRANELEEELKISHFNWNIVRASVCKYPFNFFYYCDSNSRIYMLDHYRRQAFLKFATILFELFEKYRCTDYSVISDVLQVVCLICFEGDNKAAVDCLNWVYLRSCHKNCQQNITEFGKLFRMPYRTLPKSVHTTMDVVRLAATGGNLGLLDVLLRFGAMFVTPMNVPYEWDQVEIVMKSLFIENTEKHSDIEEHFLQNIHMRFIRDTKRRLFLIMRVMEIFAKIQIQPQYADLYKECARLLFSSIPEPFVTSDEIREYLCKLFLNICPYEDVVELSMAYESHFPESRQALRPRSLQHLCRFQARENLRAAGTLPHGVLSLSLPSKMKNYILLKEENVVCERNIFTVFRPKFFNNGSDPYAFPMVSDVISLS